MRHWAWLLVLVMAAGCGGGADGAATPTPGDPGWVVLDDVEIDVDAIILRGATPEVVIPEDLSRAEAEARLPFPLPAPAWAPEGFAALDLVEVVAPEDAGFDDYVSAILTWEDADGAQVQLQVSVNAPGPRLGAAGAGREVTVNGSAATLVETRGLGTSRLSLSWARRGLDFRLTANGGAVTGDDLVRMAESIP